MKNKTYIEGYTVSLKITQHGIYNFTMVLLNKNKAIKQTNNAEHIKMKTLA